MEKSVEIIQPVEGKSEIQQALQRDSARFLRRLKVCSLGVDADAKRAYPMRSKTGDDLPMTPASESGITNEDSDGVLLNDLWKLTWPKD